MTIPRAQVEVLDNVPMIGGTLHTMSPSSANAVSRKPSVTPLGRLNRMFKSHEPQSARSKTMAAVKWAAHHPQGLILHSPQDPSPETNPTHRLLPEEHEQAWNAAHECRASLLDSAPPSTSSSTQRRKHFSAAVDLQFLTPLERRVLHLLRQTRRASLFHPLLSPATSVLLVQHQADVKPLNEVQNIVRDLPEKERQMLASDLHRFLAAEHLYILRLLLFHDNGGDEMRITADCRGDGVQLESPKMEAERDRPETGRFWEYISKIGKKEEMQEGFKISGLSSKAFEVPGHDKLRLRGGGGSLPFERSARAYWNFATCKTKKEKLEDAERVPRALWWLAGGRVGNKKRAPTAGQLRQRRQAEVPNREVVGFAGTLLGYRSRRVAQSRAAPVDTPGEIAADGAVLAEDTEAAPDKSRSHPSEHIGDAEAEAISEGHESEPANDKPDEVAEAEKDIEKWVDKVEASKAEENGPEATALAEEVEAEPLARASGKRSEGAADGTPRPGAAKSHRSDATAQEAAGGPINEVNQEASGPCADSEDAVFSQVESTPKTTAEERKNDKA